MIPFLDVMDQVCERVSVHDLFDLERSKNVFEVEICEMKRAANFFGLLVVRQANPVVRFGQDERFNLSTPKLRIGCRKAFGLFYLNLGGSEEREENASVTARRSSASDPSLLRSCPRFRDRFPWRPTHP